MSTPKPSGKIYKTFVYQGIAGAGGAWSNGLEPIKNTVFFIEDPCMAFSQIMAKTDNKGMLCQVDSKLNKIGSPLSLTGTKEATVKHFFRPPAQAISLLPQAKDKDSWAKKLKNFLSDQSDIQKQPLKIESINIKDLRAPKTSAEDDNSETDEEYRSWIENQNKNKITKVSAFVIPKVRIVYFTLSIPGILISEVKINISGIVDELPTKRITGNIKLSSAGLTVFSINGSESQLPKGIWEITVVLDKKRVEKSEKWSSAVAASVTASGDNLFYTLKEAVNFDIKNPLGDFSIVLADPLSLEECLIGQYPKEFSHIVSQAKEYDGSPNPENTAQVTSGVKEYFLRWQIANTAFTKTKDLALSATFSAGDTGERFDLAKMLFTSAADALPIDKNNITRDWIDTMLKADEAWGKLSDFTDAVDKVSKGIADGAPLGLTDFKQLFKFPDYMDDAEVDKLRNSILAKYSNLDLNKLKIINNSLIALSRGVVGLSFVTGAAALGKSTYDLIFKALPDFDNSKIEYATLIKQYRLLLDKSTDDLSFKLNVKFEYNETTLKPGESSKITAIAAKMKGIIASIEADPDVPKGKAVPCKFDIYGHTCDRGEAEYNRKLSLGRAEAVRDALIKEGINEQYFGNIEGIGEDVPEEYNRDEAAREINRRVEMRVSGTDAIKSGPSRQGMQVLEHARTLTELRSIGVDTAGLKVATEAYALAIGIVAVSGGTLAPFAIALGFLFAGKDLYDSLLNTLDKTFNNSRMATIKQDANIRWGHLKSAEANMEMLTEYYEDKIDNDEDTINSTDVELATQFRIRAEVLRGLMYLLTRVTMDACPMTSDGYDKRFTFQLKQFRVEEYIHNFILNDQWSYPLRNRYYDFFDNESIDSQYHGQSLLVYAAEKGYDVISGAVKGMWVSGPAIDIGRYWANITSSGLSIEKDLIKLASQGAKPKFDASELRKYFSLDERYRLISAEDIIDSYKRSDLTPEEEADLDRLTGVKLDPFNQIYANERVTEKGHIKADFQKLFPIHNYSSSDFSELAKNLRTTWSELDKKDYLYLAVFRKVGNDWKPINGAHFGFSDNFSWFRDEERLDKEELRQNTEVCALVILGERVDTAIPISITVCRDNFIDSGKGEYSQVTGPQYSDIAQVMTDKELEPFIKDSTLREACTGRFGCIIKPNYVCGKKIINGLKPMIGNWVFMEWDPVEEYDEGELSYMDYYLDVTAGLSDQSNMRMPLLLDRVTNPDDDKGNINSMVLSVKSDHPKLDPMLVKEFLMSKSDKYTYPEVFKGEHNLSSFIRFLPKGDKKNATPYINGFSPESDLIAAEKIAKFDIDSKTRSYGLDNQFDGRAKSMRVRNFDWDTPVEFLVLLATDDVNTQGYEPNMYKMADNNKVVDYSEYSSQDWRISAASVSLFNKSQVFGNTEGPRYTSKMKYLGNIQRSGEDFIFDSGRSLVKAAGDDELSAVKKQFFPDGPISHETINQLFQSNEWFFDGGMSFSPLAMNIKQVTGAGLEAVSDDMNDKLHIFAMTVRVHYQAPNRLPVDSLRPFGDYNDDFEFTLDGLQTVGSDDFKQADSSALDNSVFIFDEVKHPYHGIYPWTKANTDIKENIPEDKLKGQLRGIETYNDIVISGMRPELYKDWLENQSKLKKYSDLNVLKQG